MSASHTRRLCRSIRSLRAQFRLALFRNRNRLVFAIAEEAESSIDGKLGTKSRKTAAREHFAECNELFGARPYFLSEEFSLVDCQRSPRLLWRLPVYGIELGSSDAEFIEAYMDRVFCTAVRSSKVMTELELEMRL